MSSIDTISDGRRCRIVSLDGDNRFMSRVIAMGLTPGCEVEILRNQKKQALLVFARDTMIAIANKESKRIFIEEI